MNGKTRDILVQIQGIAGLRSSSSDWAYVHALVSDALSDAKDHPTSNAVNRIANRLGCSWVAAWEEYVLAGKDEQLVYTKHAAGMI